MALISASTLSVIGHFSRYFSTIKYVGMVHENIFVYMCSFVGFPMQMTVLQKKNTHIYAHVLSINLLSFANLQTFLLAFLDSEY